MAATMLKRTVNGYAFLLTIVLPGLIVNATGLILHLTNEHELAHFLILSATSYLIGGSAARLTNAAPGQP